MMGSLYFLINVFAISYPLARSFENRVNYYQKWKALFPAIAITATFFIIWDVIFTQNGVWGFNDTYLLGLRFLSLPLEEWLFFVTIPFASIFIYECVNYFIPNLKTNAILRFAGITASTTLIALAFAYQDQTYTFWCFLFTGLFLAGVAFINPKWFAHFTVTYFIHLIPFLLVNGVLTGAVTDSPVVWYDHTQNLSLRIVTIPIEDTIYALLLLLMNVTLFELFRKKRGKTI